jgi:hypothetical protein
MEISNQSKKHSRAISRFYRFIYHLSPSLKSYEKLILLGHVYRPHYAYALLETAKLAKVLGHKSISILEFGCAGGAGLLDIEYHINEIKKYFDLGFELYGFDSGEGLPPSNDVRDVLYLWQPGEYKMDYNKLVNKLESTKVVIGPVSDTINDFIEKYNPAPVGCVFNDFDYYTSTRDSFKLYKNNVKYFFPRVFMYFDDTLGTSNFNGELLAINEFNSNNESQKIDLIQLKAEQLSLSWKNWIYLAKKYYYLHNFDHPEYSKAINSRNELLI